tara:strand:+ start:201 stop:524 length:324 start_codon:yes stop_codon:yes gene_type:complete
MKKIQVEDIKFEKQKLLPIIIQDYSTSQVLMLAWVSENSLKKTVASGLMTYWSRSRNCLWVKGETSGNYQKVKSIYLDCDEDCLLAKVEQIGPACHTNNKSCFFQRL